MKKFILIALGLLLLLAAIWGVWKGYPAYKRWSAQKSLQQAEDFVEKKDYRQASLSARKVLSMFPTNFPATLMMARLSQTVGAPNKIKWWQRVVYLAPDNLTNRLHLAQLALSQKNVHVAWNALEGASDADKATLKFHQVAAMVAAASGKLDQAKSHFSKAVALDPENKVLQLNLAVLQLQSTNSEIAESAEKTLQTLSQETATRRDALRQLVQVARLKYGLDQAKAYSSQLAATEEATFGDQLLHLSILAEIGGDETKQQLTKLQQDAAQQPNHVLALSTWMIAHKQAPGALDWLNELSEDVRAGRPVMMAMADGYAATENWSQLHQLLQKQTWGDLDFMRQAYLSRAASERGQFITARSQWRLALRDAGSKLETLISLLKMATAWKWDKDREDLLWTILQRFPREQWALKELEKGYLLKADTRGLLKVYAQQVSLNAKDLAAKNNLATVSFLLETKLSQAHELAQLVYEAAPDNPAYASTYAYSRHLQGQTIEGLKVMEAFQPKLLEHPALSVYYGVMLNAAGQTNKARNFLGIAQAAKLLPEEKVLVETSLRGQ